MEGNHISCPNKPCSLTKKTPRKSALHFIWSLMMFRPESTALYFSGISATSNEGKFSLEQAFDLLFFAKCYKFFLVLGYLNKKASEKTFIFANGDLVAHCDEAMIKIFCFWYQGVAGGCFCYEHHSHPTPK